MDASAERMLKASEAAWLARVNDDRVRDWFKDIKYPSTPDGGVRTVTTWDDLAAFCRTKRKRPPLPVAMLDVDATEAAQMLDAQALQDHAPPAESPQDATRNAVTSGADVDPWMDPDLGREIESGELRLLRQNLARARVREDGLVAALRAQASAAAAAEKQAAEQRTALMAMTETLERLTHIDDLA